MEDKGLEKELSINAHTQIDNDTTTSISELSRPTSIGRKSPEPTAIDEKPAALPEEEEQYEYMTGFKLGIVLAAVTLTAFLSLLDTTIVVTAIPRITSHFHSLDDVGWYGSAYLLCNCSLQPLSGKLYTYFSSKYIFLTFLFIFEFGSLLCGVAVSSNMLIVGRAVAGMGSSGLMNGALTIITHALPIEKRPVYVGIMMSFAQLAMAVGPVIGGALTQYTTWRWCFYINLPCGFLISMLILFIQIPQRLHPSTKTLTPLQRILHLDLIGFALFAPTVIQCLLALEWGGTTYAWSSSHVIGLFVGSFFNILLFLYWEYRTGDEAMIPLFILKIRAVYSSCISQACFLGSTMTISYYLPIYFQAVRDVSPTLSGVYTLPGILMQMLLAVTSGFAVQKIGYYTPFGMAGGVFGGIAYGLFSTFTPTTSTAAWVCYQIIGGIGRGVCAQMGMIALQNNVPVDFVTIGTTVMIFFQYFGATLSLTFASTIFSASLKSSIRKYAPGVDAAVIVEAGATAYRTMVPESQLPGVIKAYSVAVDHTFYFAAGIASVMLLSAWGMGWKKLGQKDAKNKNTPQEGGDVDA